MPAKKRQPAAKVEPADEINEPLPQNEKRKPTHGAYVVREGKEGDKSWFTKIGAAFEHEDGEGYSVILDALPVDGKIVLRTPRASRAA